MRKAYRDLEDYIVDLFNNIDGVIHWNNKTYDRIAACKPYPQRGGGECKTDVYVLLNNTQEGTSDEIKISVKKDDAEFLANKLKAPVAEDLFGSDWKNILTDNINQIKNITEVYNVQKLIEGSTKYAILKETNIIEIKLEDNLDLSNLQSLANTQGYVVTENDPMKVNDSQNLCIT